MGVGNGVREKTERGEKEESERERGLERALTGRERGLTDSERSN